MASQEPVESFFLGSPSFSAAQYQGVPDDDGGSTVVDGSETDAAEEAILPILRGEEEDVPPTSALRRPKSTFFVDEAEEEFLHSTFFVDEAEEEQSSGEGKAMGGIVEAASTEGTIEEAVDLLNDPVEKGGLDSRGDDPVEKSTEVAEETSGKDVEATHPSSERPFFAEVEAQTLDEAIEQQTLDEAIEQTLEEALFDSSVDSLPPGCAYHFETFDTPVKDAFGRGSQAVGRGEEMSGKKQAIEFNMPQVAANAINLEDSQNDTFGTVDDDIETPHKSRNVGVKKRRIEYKPQSSAACSSLSLPPSWRSSGAGDNEVISVDDSQTA